MTARPLQAAALVLAMLAPAQAQQARFFPVFPPAHYDHPYDGPVYVSVIEDMAFLADACKPTKNPMGCAFKTAIGCLIIMAPDDVLKAHGFTAAIVKRHERAHCNGWPGDHPGAQTLKKAGKDTDATLGTSLIDMPGDKFITVFRAERARMQQAKEVPKTAAGTIWPEPAKTTIWPEPDVTRNIWPAK